MTVTTPTPTAMQILSPHGTIQRIAHCPVHGKRTTKMLGVQESLLEGMPHLWAFACAYLPHNFVAWEDPLAPKTPEASIAWVQKQRENLLLEKSRRKGA